MRMRTALWLLLINFCFTACQNPSRAPSYFRGAQSPKGKVLLLFSGNIKGSVEPCGCTTNPLGGISRLSTLVSQARKTYTKNTVYIDLGNLLTDSREILLGVDACSAKATASLAIASLAQLQPHFSLYGPYDSALGTQFYDETAKKYHLQSAFRPQLLELSQVKIGLVRLESSTNQDLAIQEKRIVQEAQQLRKEGASFIVLISQIDLQATREIQQKLQALDAIVLAAPESENFEIIGSQLGEGPPILSLGGFGQQLGVIEWHINRKNPSNRPKMSDEYTKAKARISLLSKRLESVTAAATKNKDQALFWTKRQKQLQLNLVTLNKGLSASKKLKPGYFNAYFVPVDQTISQDLVVLKLFDNYEKSLPELSQLCEKGLVCPTAPAGAPSFVGSLSCKKCHTQAYQFWEKAVSEVKGLDVAGKVVTRLMGHSQAFLTLKKGGKEKDRSCIGCHVAGFMQPGGFCKVEDSGPFQNVQCESCHGAGSLHAKLGTKGSIIKRVPESKCRTCHHVPHIQTPESFNYHERLRKILGKGHGEALLKALAP